MRRETSKEHWMKCVVIGTNENGHEDMTKDQRIIAEAAIAKGQAATYEMIREKVSLTTGVPITDVRETLDYLLREAFLKECATPTRNLMEGSKPDGETTWAWYEKGGMWPR